MTNNNHPRDWGVGTYTEHLGEKFQAIAPIIPAYSPPGTPRHTIRTLRPQFRCHNPSHITSVPDFEHKQASKQTSKLPGQFANPTAVGDARAPHFAYALLGLRRSAAELRRGTGRRCREARTSREKVERAAMASSTGMAMSPARPRPPERRRGAERGSSGGVVGSGSGVVVPCVLDRDENEIVVSRRETRRCTKPPTRPLQSPRRELSVATVVGQSGGVKKT